MIFRHRQFGRIKLFGVVMAACLMVTACGVKAPPVPPGYVPPVAVRDLQYTLEEDSSVVLSWSLPEPGEGEAFNVEGVKILRSKETLGNAECENCPHVYIEIKDMPLNKDNQRYRDPLEKGYRYYYKIVIYDDNNLGSGDSNVVSFEYP